MIKHRLYKLHMSSTEILEFSTEYFDVAVDVHGVGVVDRSTGILYMYPAIHVLEVEVVHDREPE